MSRRDTDRNLLFGINALQNDFVTRDALITGMAAWALEKHRPLGEILVDRGALKPDDRAMLERLLDHHLARLGNDPAASLAAMSSIGSVADDLRRSIADSEILESLATVAPLETLDSISTIAGIPTTRGGVRFRKVREHASGNLGVVYVARDEELNREVALKEIKERNADHPSSRAKFLLEAEVTGGLEHPGIVPVYGLGHHEDGRPFYAMRFIRGESLLDAIRRFHADDSLKADPGRRVLELQKLLRRFTDVCNAVAYAHSRGILHRDLKPDNVMVGKYGETLVVDWGLAKALGRSGESSGTFQDPDDPLPEGSLQPSSADGLEATQVGSLVGTPAYMSPEQAAGRLDLLGPASDVYGLGATLYHLIVGRPPIQGEGLGDLLARVEAGQLPRPRSVAPWLDPALEAICLKAMAREPGARYPSPRALAEDLDRWIAGEPVTAWREPWLARARRVGRRHRGLVAGSALAASAILVAFVVGTVLVSRERGRAIANLEESRKVVRAMFDKIAPRLVHLKDMDETQREILESGLRFYENFVLTRSQDPEVLHEVGDVYGQMANIQNRLGRAKEAEATFRQALDTIEPLVSAHPGRADYRKTYGSTLHDLAGLYDSLGRPKEAEPPLRKSVDLRRALADAAPKDARARRDLGSSLFSLALLLDHDSRRPEAEAFYQQAVAIQEDLVKAHPETAEYRDALALSLYELGYLFARTLRRDEALRIYQRVVQIQGRLVDDHPGNTSYRSRLSGSLSYLGTLYRRAGRLAEAEETGRRAVVVQEVLADDHPNVPGYRDGLAKSCLNMGNFYKECNRLDEAETYYRKALGLGERLVREHPERVGYVETLGGCHCRVGEVLERKDDLAGALRRFDEAIHVYQTVLDRQPMNSEVKLHLRDAYAWRAAALDRLGRHADAITDWERALESESDPAELTIRRLGRALAVAHLGDYRRALADLDRPEPESKALGEIRYAEAQLAAACAEAALHDPTLADAERRSLGSALADRAMKALGRARESGFFQAPGRASRLSRDREWQPLRSRPDFQAFLMDASFPIEAIAR